jgi:hypothetical protein
MGQGSEPVFAAQTARPWGSRDPTPAEAWQERRRPEAKERAAFLEAVKRRQREARQQQGYPADTPLQRAAQAAVDRVAIRDALVAAGLLRIQ